MRRAAFCACALAVVGCASTPGDDCSEETGVPARLPDGGLIATPADAPAVTKGQCATFCSQAIRCETVEIDGGTYLQCVERICAL